MNFKILIHAIILLFILHIIIINIDYEIDIGKKVEKFKNNNTKIINSSANSSLDFLLENKEKDNEFIQKMNELNFSSDKKEPVNKNMSDILPSNNYLSNDNTPNFESTVEDTSKFYIQNNYDDLNEKQLQSTSLDDLNKKSNNISTNMTANMTTNIETNIKQVNNTRESKENPSIWEYNNEFAMNGGDMNGIIGFDGLESQYADFGSPLAMTNSEKPQYNNIPHDDLRKPVVVN
jgi:hypothetical protein